MIIREKHVSGVKYTHDEEALLAAMLSWGEFRTMEPQVRGWIESRRDYAFNKDYWHHPEEGWFIPCDRWDWFMAKDRPGVTKVELWDVDACWMGAREDIGCACACCRHPTHFSERGGLFGEGYEPVKKSALRRQYWLGVPHLCQGCAYDLSMVFWRQSDEQKAAMAGARLATRAIKNATGVTA